MKRFAFTMLELVFVLIVIGILAVFAMPNFNRHPLQEAAEQVASHIRYTQHLAMVDDKFDPNDGIWFSKRWQIRFPNTTIAGEKIYYYEVFRDEDQQANSDIQEEAIDPLSNKTIGDGVTAVASLPEDALVNLTKKYGITNVIITANNNCKVGGVFPTIAFDNIGRPYNSVYYGANDLLTGLYNANCVLTLEHKSDGNASITISPQTGYVSITYN